MVSETNKLAYGVAVSDIKRSDLSERMDEYRRKIEEISAFRDDPKIDKIIRALQK
jgi:hypothetical protein